MTWRVYRDESKYSDLDLLAWEWALPFGCLPIIDTDYKEVKKYKKLISKSFSKQAISSAVKRLNLRGKYK